MSSIFESLIQNIPAIFYRCACDERWTTHFMSPAVMDVLGYPYTDFIDNQVRTFASVIHSDDRDYVETSIFEAVEKGIPWSIEYRVVNSDGVDKWVSETGVGVLPENDSTMFLEGFIYDCSERVLLAQELAKVRKMEAIGQLVEGVAHELNTPIQFIGDNLHFLADAFKELNELIALYGLLVNELEAGVDPALLMERSRGKTASAELEYLIQDIPQSLSESSDGVDRISEIVIAMKEFARPGEADKTSVELKKVIENTLLVSQNTWKSVADLETEFDPEMPLLECYPGEISQVILNVIVNAAQAIRTRQITEQLTEKGVIRIKTFRDDRYSVLSISDTGCGINAENLDKVFNPFFTTKEVGQGVGQGLSIAYSIVTAMHHGRIEVDSELGVGTTLSIKLPLS